MNEPEVFVLMLRVDDWGTQVVTRVLGDLRVSFQTISLNRPDAWRYLDYLPEWIDLVKHYLKVCPRVIFIVGEAAPDGVHDGLLQRLGGMVNEREQDGGDVSRLKLGDNLPQVWEPEFPRHETIPRGNEAAITRFIKQEILGPVLGGGSAGRVKRRPPKPTSTDVFAVGSEDDQDVGTGGLLDKILTEGRIARDPLPGGGTMGGGLSIADDDSDIDMPSSPDIEPKIAIPPHPDAQLQTDEVVCTVYSPRLAAPGDEILVQAFAHLREQEEAVAAMSAVADPQAAKVGTRLLDQEVAEGERVGFHLTLRGAEIDAPNQEFVWEREPLAAQFGVYFPETSQPRDVVGTVLVTKGGVPVGHVKFTLRVVTREQKDAAASAAAERAGEYSRYHTAFVSYASKDRERVLPRVQALAAARIKVFQDFIELEPGERWERELYKHIDECDVFFLFWSQAAKASKWVCEETKYAHARQGENDERPPEIIPIIIEGPPPPEPPPELNFLQFNDKYLYLLKGVEAEAEARRKEQT